MTLMPRLIPILQIRGTSAVKTTQFAGARYIGNAVNSMRIYSELEADELIVLDLTESQTRFSARHMSFLESLCSEGFMPLSYGGRVSSVDRAVSLARIGFEKVVLGTAAVEHPRLVSQTASVLGAQAVVLAVDVVADGSGHRVVIDGGSRQTSLSLAERLSEVPADEVGEVLVTSVDREGLKVGLDQRAVHSAVSLTQVPVVVSGGAKSLEDCAIALRMGASAVAIGEIAVSLGGADSTLVHLPPGFDNVQGLVPG